jgi:hypothetical protein
MPLTTRKVDELQIAYINPVKSFEATAADAKEIFDIPVSW